MKHALVLGAGIMGLSAAWGLRRAGWSVTLVEQDGIPNERGASVDDHRLIRHPYGAELGYMRMVNAAHEAWDRLWADLGETLYVPTGLLALADAPGGWLAESRAGLTTGNHPFADLDAPGLAARFPMLSGQGIHAAFQMDHAGVLLARRIVASLARHLAANGVRFLRARATEADPARASLTLEDGTRQGADLLVIAAGPWMPRFLPSLAGRVTASRQITVYLEPPPAHRAAWSSAPMVLDLASDGGFYAVPPVAGTALKVGDHRFSLSGDAETDGRIPTPAEIEGIMALVRPRLRDAAEYRIIGARACYYDVEPEERFILEPLGDRALVMSGFSGHGFKFGPLLGLAVGSEDRLSRAGWAAGRGLPVTEASQGIG
jgi:sarcosine oxidase subunit beta